MTDRKCYKCKQPGGRGPRELRPYGPGGKDLCAECMFGSKGQKPSPKLEEEARRQLLKSLMAPGPLVIDPEEQAGPRSLKSKSRNN